MSDKTPISLHNSDLFFNSEITNIDRKKINTDNATNSILKKGPSLGEHNHLISLHASYLLPPLHTSKYLSKAVTSYLLTKQNFGNGYKKSESEQSKDWNEENENVKQSQAFLPASVPNNRDVFKHRRNLSQSLRHELRPGLSSRSKGNVEVKKNYDDKSESCIVKKTEHLTPEQTKTNHGLIQFNTEIDNNDKKSFPGSYLLMQTQPFNLLKFNSYLFYSKVFLGRLNKIINLSISREFLLVTTNLVLFSILAIVQRSQYGKNLLPPSSKGSYNILYGSKMPNITPSYITTAEVRQYLPESLRPKWYNFAIQHKTPIRFQKQQKQEDFVGVFSGKPDMNFAKNEVFCKNSYKTGGTKINTQDGQMPNKVTVLPKLCFSTRQFRLPVSGKLPKTLFSIAGKDTIFSRSELENVFCFSIENKTKPSLLTNFGSESLSTNKLKKSTYLGNYFIQPWYCIKSCNTFNNQIVATRSLWPGSKLLPCQSEANTKVSLPKTSFFATTSFCNLVRMKRDSGNKIGSKNVVLRANLNARKNSTLTTQVPCKKRSFLNQLGFGTQSISFLRQQNSNKVDKNWNIYNENKIQGFQYYLPFYKSQERIFAETDTIPSKRNTIDSKKTRNSNSLKRKQTFPSMLSEVVTENSGQVQLSKNLFLQHMQPGQQSGQSSYIATSQSLLKKCFYKYGLVVVEPSKKISEVQSSNEADKDFFSRSQYSGEIKQRLNLIKPEVRNNVSAFGFTSDKLVRNTCVSGYRFPELREKEIVYLFRKKVIFDFYLNRSDNKIIFQKLLTQLTTPFRTFKSNDLITQVLSTPFLLNYDGVVISQTLEKCLSEQKTARRYKAKNSQSNLVFSKQSFGTGRHGTAPNSLNKAQLVDNQSEVHNRSLYPLSFNQAKFDSLFHSQNEQLIVPEMEVDGIKMQYTQVDLDETKNIKDVFKKLGRDYEDYLRQPKDSLPALIISPSLEDDYEIEEEGIRIFRKRDLVKNKRSSGQDQNDESGIDSGLFLSTTTPGLPEKKSMSGSSKNEAVPFQNKVLEMQSFVNGRASKNEIQNHQLLVKNALRQAQEDIDNIAKKEEKGAEKDKQVIPPLTRLEALYTIRNRERKCEQAKDLTPVKGIISHLRSYRSGTKVEHPFSEKNQTKNQTAKHISLPIFEKLFLYSDKPNSDYLNKSTWFFTPWLFAKFGDENICTDRKHSFFGEMSLLSKKLTAQEQKQIFQQKANPLLKVKTKNNHFSVVELAPSTSKVVKLNNDNFNFNLVSDTVPLSLLSQFSILDKDNYNKNEIPQLQVGKVSVNCLPPFTWGSKTNPYQTLSPITAADTSFRRNSNVQTPVKQSQVLSQSTGNKIEIVSNQNLGKITLPEKVHAGHVTSAEDLFRSKSRIYFYDNLSQNKACQGSAPKIKSTPLQSPVSHRVWQPKRMEPSTFRVFQRSKSTPVLPKITQKDWKNIIEWQLKKYFIEEDKRLFSLSSNDNKKLKIKKINLYLPWIFIKKPSKPLNKEACLFSFKTNQVPKSHFDKLDLTCKKQGLCKNEIFATYSYFQNKVVANTKRSLLQSQAVLKNKVFYTQRTTECKTKLCQSKALAREGKALAERSSVQRDENKFGSMLTNYSNKNSVFDCETTDYWRLPTQQTLYTATLPVKKQSNSSLMSTNLISQLLRQIKGNTRQKQSFNTKLSIPLPCQSEALEQRDAKQSFATGCLNKFRLQKTKFFATTSYSQKFKKKAGICKKVFNEAILFEPVTKYSWLFIYTFVFVLMFKQLFTFVYKVGLKDFFINFLNSDFGRTITSEEFRYSIQNSSLPEFYMPKKRLQELFGIEKNKVQLLDIVWFLRNHCQGRNGPRGILLVGPPGVESVSVVQAIAGEANLPIIVQSLEKIAQDNEPQRQLEQLYTRAHKQAPCVLFLDQLDTIGARRDQLFTDTMRGRNGNPLISSGFGQDAQVTPSLDSRMSLNSHTRAFVSNVSEQVNLFVGESGALASTHNDINSTISSNPFQKNQGSFAMEDQNVTFDKSFAETSFHKTTNKSFVSPGNKLNVVLRLLTILDGITQSSGVVTVATARDLTKLDPALLRPKRFDRRIYLSLPNQQDRAHLFKVETQNIGHIKEMPWNYLSLQTENMSAADIRSAINYSFFRAVLKNSVHTLETLEYGIDCVKTLMDKQVEKKQKL